MQISYPDSKKSAIIVRVPHRQRKRGISMHTPENLYYHPQTSHDNSSCELQVHPIKSQHSIPDSQQPHSGHSARKRRRLRQFQWKCALSASIVILTAATGAMLYLLNTSTNPLQKISSPSYFSDLDSGQQELSSASGQRQGKKTGSASIQEGIVHITSFSDEWNLILVNPWNPVPDDYTVNLVPVQSGHFVDARCYPDLQRMLDDCSEAGLYPLICSSYRTQQTQQELFDERVDELTAQGYKLKNAYEIAATSVANPGTSEHQIGLAVDIVDKNHQLLDRTQETTLVQQWLMENSWKYGFILRYPDGTSDLTGIIYEPWHYRYVGKKAAKKIHKRGICLEEYLAELM